MREGHPGTLIAGGLSEQTAQGLWPGTVYLVLTRGGAASEWNEREDHKHHGRKGHWKMQLQGRVRREAAGGRRNSRMEKADQVEPANSP